MSADKYKKGGLLLSENTLLLFDRMTDEEGFVFLKLIRNYHRDGTLPPSDTERLVSISFDLFKADYDASQMKYREKVARMLKNRDKQEISKTSQEVTETSQEICKTSQEIVSNTIHNITSHNTKEEYKEEVPASPSVCLSPDYSNFLDWLNSNCTHLLKMNIPTEEEYQKLMEAADQNKKTLTDKLLAMENNKVIPKTKRGIYQTCLEWLERDKK